MIGVRLPSGVVRTDIMRCLVVVAAAIVAATVGWGHIGIQGAAKSKSAKQTTDPFLDDDTGPPAADEIPAIPELESPAPKQPPKIAPPPRATTEAPPEESTFELPPDLDLKLPDERSGNDSSKSISDPISIDEPLPEFKAPRVKRDIKATALPKLDEPADIAEITDLTTGPSAKPKLPSLKNTPIGDKPGWKSSDVEPSGVAPAGAGQGPQKPTSDGPLAERARLERSPELSELNEPLADIVIEGNKAIKTNEIMKLIKSHIGRPYDPKITKEDVRTLVSKRWFFDVEPRIAHSKKGPVLVFRVREKPLLEKITYVGNKKIKVKELTELVEQCGLKVGGGYDISQNREAVHRILTNYREKGFRHATVELEKGDSLEDREVVFKIVEGPKVKVSRIVFSGNKDFSSAVLKTQVKTKTEILWLFGGKYDPSSIQEDLTALRQYYMELGYFDVRIRHEEHVSKDKAKVTFKYLIEEGMRYKVRNIEFVGNRVIPEQKLREDMKVKPGDFWAHRFINADREKMVAQYGELGRIFAKVEPRQRSYEEPGYVDLIYEIKEDRPYRIGRINVHIAGDHPHTKENAVLTKLTFKPGELASMAKIEKSKQRLKNAMIFAGGRPGPQSGPGAGPPPEIVFKPSEIRLGPKPDLNLARGQDDVPEAPVRIPKPEPANYDGSRSLARGQSPGNLYESLPNGDVQDSPPGDNWFQPEEEQPGLLDIDTYVSETQTGRINLGVSVNSNAGLMGSAILEENNFDLFRPPTSMQDVLDGVAWRGGGQQFRIEAMPGLNLSRYLINWRDPYFLDQNLSFGVSGYYQTRVIPSQWWEKRGGGRVNLGHQFTPITSGSITLRAENVQILNPAIPVPPDVEAVLGNTFLSTVKGTLVHDTRDSAFLPGKGHYAQFDYEQGFGNFVYPKFDVEAKQYFLVHERPDGGNRQVISVVGQFGYIGNEAPVYERYFAGGFASFRGYRFYGVTPRVNGVGVGGQFQGLGTVEYLLPITADNVFQIVAFTDFGSVDSRVTFDHYRQTVGAGIRLAVPMMGPMPIAIDFAVPVVRQSGDIIQVVSFTMGLLK
jgi:outer membrane protein insertion porin family